LFKSYSNLGKVLNLPKVIHKTFVEDALRAYPKNPDLDTLGTRSTDFSDRL
jgi:hypothetical protein